MAVNQEEGDGEEGSEGGLKMKRINSLFEKDDLQDKESKQYEQDLIKQLHSSDPQHIWEEDQLKHIQFGIHLTPKDVKQLFYGQNELRLQLMGVEEENKRLSAELVHLKDELKAELRKEMPDI